MNWELLAYLQSAGLRSKKYMQSVLSCAPSRLLHAPVETTPCVKLSLS